MPLPAQVPVLGLRLLEQRDQPPFLADEVLVLEVVPPVGLHKRSEAAEQDRRPACRQSCGILNIRFRRSVISSTSP